jgi:rare lipoprotein A
MGRGAQRLEFWHVVRIGAVAAGCLALANCSANKFGKVDPKYGTSASPRVVDIGEPVPKGGGAYRVGKPYMIAGRTYVPEENINYRSEGTASWYGDDFHGRLTANGEVFDMHSISAAHPTLPMPSYVRVTNLANRKSIVVRVNDRGPYAGNRVIDVSVKAAQLLGFHEHGLAKVRVEYVGRAPIEGSDDRQLLATLRQDGPAPAPSAVRVASARPFLPEVSEPVPSERQPVPAPQERPFKPSPVPAQASLQTYPDTRPPELTSATKPAPKNNARVEAAALPPISEPKLSAAPGSAPASGTLGTLTISASSPVSAYAPTRYDGPAAFSGRGLY